ncbi:hypothetical protein LTR64_003874 [Lithohypha guttulata]|uniref:uncharacterized protein n=1 Tax=Lithohypha guttulata TaxID=1690604 RepID=UPI002DDE3F15|nr:hypothetical protein LTR51_006912 [Lithohypha guttulata]
MARIARDSTPKRRSARLSNQQPEDCGLHNQSAYKPRKQSLQLDTVIERDETPDIAEQPLIDNVIVTPSTRHGIEDRLRELSKITTPKTEPRPDNNQMHPATIHQTTAKAPDSGMKLGFADIKTTGRASVASLQNTPSRPRQSLAHTNISPSFQFKFSHETNLSEAGQQLMDTIREEAAKIKERMQVERELQEEKDAQAEGSFDTAVGRKIAKPTAKASRFSDVHMAQFKKMDSVENHASAWRVRPGYARPTAQSLKRNSTVANLDDPERSKIVAKSPSRIPPPVTGRAISTSPFKTIRTTPAHASDASAKRLRRVDDEDVSDSRPVTALARPVSSRLLSPTKASTARVAESITPTSAKQSSIPRSNSIRSIRTGPQLSFTSPAKVSQPQMDKPLPPTPGQASTAAIKHGLTRSNSTKSLAPLAQIPQVPQEASTSRIPTFASLKSILRSPKKNPVSLQAGTPKQPSTIPVPASSQKKVDFTPSVKSRYAVKLAEGSPSPAKLDRSQLPKEWEPAIPYDSSAFVVTNDDDWEDDDSAIVYPSLTALDARPPTRQEPGPVNHTIDAFTQNAKNHGRRESTEFKSIFTTLHPKPDTPSTTLTSVNTNLNRTNPVTNAYCVATSPPKQPQSPPTIRQVRTSEPVQPFEDRIQTVPHGLPGKKRRMASEIANDKFGNDDDAKENRRVTHAASIPGAWNDSVVEEDEGEKRGGKRVKVAPVEEPEQKNTSPLKKPSAARELAAKTAKERKVKASIGGAGAAAGTSSRGVLSLSRLNMLARPKNRG